jgi:flagellar protein FlgJ
MINPPVYTDFQQLDRLRYASAPGQESADTIREAATQFESLFLQMMLKAMRDSSFGDSLMDSEQGKQYRELFDSQLAVTLSSQRSLGVADMILKQLQIEPGTTLPGSGQFTPAYGLIDRISPFASGSTPPVSAAGFVSQLRPYAEKAAAELGVSPDAIVAQAVLETGWGKAIVRHPDGRNSFNLFGIKATADWRGESVMKTTLEYEDGQFVKQRAAFRAYDSYADAFADYVRFIKQPRYADAINAGPADAAGYLRGLQAAGYATDPAYADKINGILNGNKFVDAMLADNTPKGVR